MRNALYPARLELAAMCGKQKLNILIFTVYLKNERKSNSCSANQGGSGPEVSGRPGRDGPPKGFLIMK